MDEFTRDLAKGIEILIVEDSPTQAAQLDHHLTGRGYQVTVTRNGREALASALQKRPSMIITDIVMPEMDGYTLCREIKSKPETKEIPLILLTSLAGPQDVLKGLECGADNFIRKPYDHRYLISRIEYILMNLELRKNERMQMGVQLYFGGQKYFITAEKQQILDLLISTYEGAIQINQDLATKQLELNRERDLLHTLMDNVPDLIYFKDIESRFTTINRAQANILGISDPEEAVGKTDFDYFSPDHAREAKTDERRILETGEPLVGKIELAQIAGGPPIWLSTTKMLIRDFAGSSIGTFGVSRDITESKLAAEQILRAKDELETRVAERTSELASAFKRLEAELAERKRVENAQRETEARFQFLFANNPLPMWLHDRDTAQFLEVNDAAIAHYGYSSEEFARMRIDDLRPEDELAGALSGEARHRRKNGRIVDVEIAFHSIEWRGRHAVLVVAKDVTEQKRLQREFTQAQKMEAIGTLAAGVAHDFNNLLTVVNGYCGFILDQLNSEDPIYNEIVEINRAGERAATLTRQLLAFSRKQMFQVRIIDLNTVVADMDRMLRRLIGADIDLVSVLDSKLGKIKADPSQMEQIIMNLAVNARDAMPKGGKLTIETRNMALEAGARHPELLSPGPHIMLAVTDTGVGMDAETRARIFEPFFTTKGPGKGTGLGLSTVYGIVEQSGGSVLVYSEVGHGTTFRVYLPQAEGETAAVSETAAAAPARGSETLLVVEDEDGVRALECRILEKQGYSVLTAANGDEAIQASGRHKGKIDLLITDMVMPAMNGRDLAEILTAQRPGMKVLFTSGYTDNAIIHNGALTNESEFLAKPFVPQALSRKVREVLDKEIATQPPEGSRSAGG